MDDVAESRLPQPPKLTKSEAEEKREQRYNVRKPQTIRSIDGLQSDTFVATKRGLSPKVYSARDIDLKYGKYAGFPGNEKEISDRDNFEPPYSLKEVKELGIEAARAKYA